MRSEELALAAERAVITMSTVPGSIIFCFSLIMTLPFGNHRINSAHDWPSLLQYQLSHISITGLDSLNYFGGEIAPIPVTSILIFPLHALVWNILTKLGSTDDPVWLLGMLYLTAPNKPHLFCSQLHIHIHRHIPQQCFSLERPIWMVLPAPSSSKPILRNLSSKQLQRTQDTEKFCQWITSALHAPHISISCREISKIRAETQAHWPTKTKKSKPFSRSKTIL